MAGPESKTTAGEDQDAGKKAAATESGKVADGAAAAEQAAARRPVRQAKGSPKSSGPNKGRPSKVNQGNRSSRAVREKGANKAPADIDPDKEEEEEEDDDRRAADKFWQMMVAGSYSSRKARGDWGGDAD